MEPYSQVNLNRMLNSLGEDRTKQILSSFSCPKNADVENFLKNKAIPFSRSGWAQTHLVFATYKESPVLVGYFALANKDIDIESKALSQSLKKKIRQFALFDESTKTYRMATPLIGQLSKNFTNNHNELITGDELLHFACEKIRAIQMEIGGRFVYVECEDKEELTEFYKRNGFVEFCRRSLDPDETDVPGEYLVQMIRYLKTEKR